MKRRTLERWKYVGLLVFFAGVGCLSLLAVLANIGVWKDSGFTSEKYAISEGVASARFFVVFGGGAFALCAFCVYHLLRDLGVFGKRQRVNLETVGDGVLLEGGDGLGVVAEKFFDGRCRLVATAQPDDFWGVAVERGHVGEIGVLAATYELDVSLAMDDLGWHFGNRHNQALAEETARGLDELGANELARIFRAAFEIAKEYWNELGSENWMDWYHGSALETAVSPLAEQAWDLLHRKKLGILKYWVDYARRHPDKVGVNDS